MRGRRKFQRIKKKTKFFSFSTLGREKFLLWFCFIFNAKIIELRMFISYISSLPTCLVFFFHFFIFLILCKQDTFLKYLLKIRRPWHIALLSSIGIFFYWKVSEYKRKKNDDNKNVDLEVYSKHKKIFFYSSNAQCLFDEANHNPRKNISLLPMSFSSFSSYLFTYVRFDLISTLSCFSLSLLPALPPIDKEWK